MKKIIILILAIVIVIVPFSSSYGEEQALIDLYKDNDTLLSDYSENYESLIEDRKETIEFYDNYRINRRSTYNMAISYASKENGLNQVDFNIHNALYNMKAREALLEINYRKTLRSLYSKGNAVDSSYLNKSESLEQYNEVVSNNQLGYESDIEVLQAKYNYKKAENSYLSSLRSLDSSLRSFETEIGSTLSYNDIEFDFSYEMPELQSLDFYIESALKNSPSIVLTQQSINRYETELKHLTKYYISENLAYYREKKESVELNLALSELTLKQNEITLRSNIEDQYKSLLIKKEELEGPVSLSLEIEETNYEISRDLYNRKLIDYSELVEAQQDLESAKDAVLLSYYDYVTQIMELEYDCACFMPEDEQ